jgi:uncharacterized membrane protein YphA (DoxX/SURF4 family)
MTAVSTAFTALSFFLAFAFFMGGINKIAPVHAPTYATMVAASQHWPSALHLDKIGVDATTLRVAIGITEVFAAIILLTPAVSAVAAVLQFIMVGAAYTHIRLEESPVPPLVMFALLGALQVLRTMARKEAAAPAAAKRD